MIPLLVTTSQVLVFELPHIKALRKHGIVGVLSGSLPKAPQQNVFLGLPLQLSPYEALWLVEAGHCCFVDSVSYNSKLAEQQQPGTTQASILGNSVYVVTQDTLSDVSEDALRCSTMTIDDFLSLHAQKPKFWENYGAFCCLRNMNYFLMPGLRFGGTFVAYPGDPLNFHSHLIVKVLKQNEQVKLLDIVASGRLATAVKKAWILVDAKPPKSKVAQGGSKAFSIEWAGFG